MPDTKPDPKKDDQQQGPGPLKPPNPASSQEDQAVSDAEKKATEARQAAAKKILDKLKDKYTDVHPNPGGYLPFEGVCLRCGWHTLELSEDAAKALVEAHIAVHWADATGAGGVLAGMDPAMAGLRREAILAQEKGAQKGGQDAVKPIEKKIEDQEKKFEELAKELAAATK